MATVGNTLSPSFQDFAQLARLRETGNKEVTLGGSSGESLKTRGSFVSRLVEIFRPEKAQAQHRAAAEAFIGAVAKELTQVHGSRSSFHQVETIGDDRRAKVLDSLRGQLAAQLEGQARLTGSDIRAALNWLNTEAPFQVYADALDKAGTQLSSLEASADDDGSVRQAIDRFDDATPLSGSDLTALKRFESSYKDVQQTLDKLFDPERGSYASLNETMADKKRAASREGNAEEAQGWGELIQWSNDQNRETNSRVKDLGGVASKVSSILTHIEQRIDAPQKTHAPLERAAVAGSEGRSILKNREAGPVDPNAVWVDDGVEAEVPKDAFRHGDVDELKARETLKRATEELAAVGPRETEFKVSFAAGREVKTIAEIDQRLQGTAPAETPAAKP